MSPDNAITGNGVGVRSTEDGAEQPLLRGNSIHGKGTGVSNDAAETLDARENWWGCPDG